MGSRRAEARSDGRESRATGDAPVRPVVPSVGLYLERPCTRMLTPCWRSHLSAKSHEGKVPGAGIQVRLPTHAHEVDAALDGMARFILAIPRDPM